MNDYSLTEKLKILMNMIFKSPLFLFSFIIALFLFIVFIIFLKKDKKINKWFFISAWLIIFIVLVIKYNSIVFYLIDSFFDSIFMALYFPNISIYITLVIISNFFLLYSFIKKDLDKSYKLINFLSSLLIDTLLILIIDVVNSNSLNINDSLVIYSNSNLLVLFELTTSIFTSWILVNLFASARLKLKKYDVPKKEKLPEIVFEDI